MDTLKMKPPINKKDIAIVGISGKFPKSEDLSEFWKRISNGEILTHTFSDEELKELDVNDKLIENEEYVRVANFIDDPGTFDYSFFDYTKAEAALMDPQVRLMHEQVWLALEDAGCAIKGVKIGVYLTASDNINWRVYTSLAKNEKVDPFFLSHISNKNFIGTLISYKLGLQGPSYYLDTACSSSLVAVHLACRNLLLKECSIAVAGGVSVSTDVHRGYLYEENTISSKDGFCRAFDSECSGITSGEGAGVIVLKRLEDALNDKDHVYAVIKSSAVNNDGDRKVGYTAPSVMGQMECIKLAHRLADVQPNTISYIETHGAGTKLGDPIEIEALNIAFNNDVNHKCAVGSVKTNMGHLDAAAGVAGLIKAALSLKNKILPASLHYNKPNPEINFESGPFYVNTKSVAWKNEKETPLRAGVSGLGIGGTNAHVILEEWIASDEKRPSRPYQLIPFSAKTKQAADRYEAKLAMFFENKEFDLADLSYTLKVGRTPFNYRKFVVCKDVSEGIEKLIENREEQIQAVQARGNRNVVFMFTGQGSQYYGMAKEIYSTEPFFKAIMDNGLQFLEKITGNNHYPIIGYGQHEEQDKELINNTLYSQPLLFLVEYAMASLLIHWGIKPDHLIGHSLGEYVAACLSDVFSFEQGLEIIVKRARLMSQIEKGAMLSIGTSVDKIEGYLNGKLDIAAVNSDDSCVVSGREENMDELIEILNENGITNNKLKISIASHSAMMEEIMDAYEMELSKLQFSVPKYMIVSNLSGKEVLASEITSPKYWLKHLREAVQFSLGISNLLQKKDSVFIEVGPGKTLSTFLRQNKLFNTNHASVTLMRHPKDELNDNQYLMNSLGLIWANGININWINYYENEQRCKISAPGYAFEKTKLPAKVDILKVLSSFKLENYQGIEYPGNNTEEDFHDLTINEAEELIHGEEKNDLERSALTTLYLAPTSSTEKKLCELLEQFFEFNNIGVNDDFFELGGDSLKAIKIINQIHKIFDVELLTSDFFKFNTIRKIAGVIDERLAIFEKGKSDNSITI